MRPPKLSKGSVRSLGRAVAHPGALRGRALGKRLREEIILHVSAVNSCYVCSKMHEIIGRRVGLSDAEVRAARAIEPSPELDARTRVALRYAELRTRGEENAHPEEVRRFERELSPGERREVRGIVDLFTFTNRLNNTVEGVLPGARRRRRKLGLPA